MKSEVDCQSVSVLIHSSQFPAEVEVSLRASLRSREMNHKFHYDTPRKSLQWLRLHEVFSPARTDPDCARIYEEVFTDCGARFAGADQVEVLSLGCGGGQKDAQLLRNLMASTPAARLRYVPVDVSAGLTLIARSAAIEAGVDQSCIAPMCIDLAESSNWESALCPVLSNAKKRIICFFGMLPNFVSKAVLPQLAGILRSGDFLLVSANLAPGLDYHAGVTRILPLYDNVPTRDWLWSVLTDLGVKPSEGEMRFSIVQCPKGDDLLRIESNVIFNEHCQIEYGGEKFEFAPGQFIRLLFSYRHTPDKLEAMLASHHISTRGRRVNKNGDEGVFLCERTGD
ncbi:MAG: hypothetical protein EXS24_01945 [Pedosphaera sp.]|nr:hypothetical protein [Pedosphaera sp.]